MENYELNLFNVLCIRNLVIKLYHISIVSNECPKNTGH